jgi:hypothetical protein
MYETLKIMNIIFAIDYLTGNLSIAKIIFIISIIILIIGIIIIELTYNNNNKSNPANIAFYSITSAMAIISLYYIQKNYNVKKFENDIFDNSKAQTLFQSVKDIMWNPQDPDYIEYDRKKEEEEYIDHIYQKVRARSISDLYNFSKSSIKILIDDYIPLKRKGYTYPYSPTFIINAFHDIYMMIDFYIDQEQKRGSVYLGTNTIYNNVLLESVMSPEGKEIYIINEDIIKEYIDRKPITFKPT